MSFYRDRNFDFMKHSGSPERGVSKELRSQQDSLLSTLTDLCAIFRYKELGVDDIGSVETQWVLVGNPESPCSIHSINQQMQQQLRQAGMSLEGKVVKLFHLPPDLDVLVGDLIRTYESVDGFLTQENVHWKVVSVNKGDSYPGLQKCVAVQIGKFTVPPTADQIAKGSVTLSSSTNMTGDVE